MTMKWFRLFSEARNDAKLRSLTDAQFRVWFNLLCLASEQGDERGVIADVDNELLALETANGDEELLGATLQRLQKLRILKVEDSTIRFINWESRQYDKASDTPEATAERKRQQREREKAARDAPQNNVTEPPVTPLSRDVTPRHATEENREEGEYILPPTPPVSEVAAVAVQEESSADSFDPTNGAPTKEKAIATIKRLSRDKPDWVAEARRVMAERVVHVGRVGHPSSYLQSILLAMESGDYIWPETTAARQGHQDDTYPYREHIVSPERKAELLAAIERQKASAAVPRRQFTNQQSAKYLGIPYKPAADAANRSVAA